MCDYRHFPAYTLKHVDSLHRSEETTYSIHTDTHPNIQPHTTACCPHLTPRVGTIFLDEIPLSILFAVLAYLTNMFHSYFLYVSCPPAVSYRLLLWFGCRQSACVQEGRHSTDNEGCGNKFPKIYGKLGVKFSLLGEAQPQVHER